MLLNVGNLKAKWWGNGAILKLWTSCQSEFSVIIQTSELIYLILESVCFLLIFPQQNHFSSAVLCHCIYTIYKYKEVFFCLGEGRDQLQKEKYGRSLISNQAQVKTKPVQNREISLSELTSHRQTKKKQLFKTKKYFQACLDF